MPQYYSDNTVPRAALIAAGVMVAGAFLLVGVVQLSGESVGEPMAAPIQERGLRFEDLADGGVAVRDARDGQLIERLEPGTNHFLRAIMRGLARERVRLGEGEETPFQLAHRADGRLTLIDPTSKRVVDLGAFGSSNSAVFAGFLPTQSVQAIQNAAIHNPTGPSGQGSKQ